MNMSARRLAAAITGLACLVIAFDAAKSQQIGMEVHRSDVRSDDGSDWQLAVSTQGPFSVRMPVMFNDYTLRDPRENLVLHGIAGVSAEGIMFSAGEHPYLKVTPSELRVMPESYAADPENNISDVRYENNDGIETVYFTAIHRVQGAHYRFVRREDATYILSINFPNERRELATQVKDEFLQSFKLKDKN
jgi:hypothetical protein